MKTKILIILIVFSVSNIFAQTDSLTMQKDILKLEKQLVKQQQKLDEYYSELVKEYRTYKIIKKQFNEKYASQDSTISSLQQVINSNSSNIKKTASEIGVKIEDTHESTKKSISDLKKKVSRNTPYWIIAILVVALLVLLVFVFVLLRKQLFKQKTDLDSNLQETRKVLEEEGIKLDTKLAEMLEKQLIIINEERAKETQTTTSNIDHSLVLKIADRLISMEKNLSRMDEKTKGLKNLKKAILSIKDNFASNDYEIVEMIGKPFDDGMKASVTYNPDSEEKSGVITRIIKPQVNYKGVMIQSAQIEVSE